MKVNLYTKMAGPESTLDSLKATLERDPDDASEDFLKQGESFEPSASAIELLANACRSCMH